MNFGLRGKFALERGLLRPSINYDSCWHIQYLREAHDMTTLRHRKTSSVEIVEKWFGEIVNTLIKRSRCLSNGSVVVFASHVWKIEKSRRNGLVHNQLSREHYAHALYDAATFSLDPYFETQVFELKSLKLCWKWVRWCRERIFPKAVNQLPPQQLQQLKNPTNLREFSLKNWNFKSFSSNSGMLTNIFQFQQVQRATTPVQTSNRLCTCRVVVSDFHYRLFHIGERQSYNARWHQREPQSTWAQSRLFSRYILERWRCHVCIVHTKALWTIRERQCDFRDWADQTKRLNDKYFREVLQRRWRIFAHVRFAFRISSQAWNAFEEHRRVVEGKIESLNVARVFHSRILFLVASTQAYWHDFSALWDITRLSLLDKSLVHLANHKSHNGILRATTSVAFRYGEQQINSLHSDSVVEQLQARLFGWKIHFHRLRKRQEKEHCGRTKSWKNRWIHSW